jgi:TonB family protein
VSIELFDDQGSVKDHGTYDEYYAGPAKSKRSFSTSESTQTTYTTAAGMVMTGPANLAYPLISQLRRVYVYPLAAMAMAPRLNLASDIRQISGVKFMCIATNTKPATPDAQTKLMATYCFDGPPESMRYAFFDSSQGPISIARSHPVSFEGRSLAGDVELRLSGKLALTAHIETIAPVTSADDAVFTPPADAVPLRPIRLIGVKGSGPSSIENVIPVDPATFGGGAQRNLVQNTAPIYPPIAKAAHVQGTVVLQARIGKDGAIKDLKVISGQPILQQAAIDAVQHWVYRPYLVGGKPVEVLTTVNVVFSLADPPKKENPAP